MYLLCTCLDEDAHKILGEKEQRRAPIALVEQYSDTQEVNLAQSNLTTIGSFDQLKVVISTQKGGPPRSRDQQLRTRTTIELVKSNILESDLRENLNVLLNKTCWFHKVTRSPRAMHSIKLFQKHFTHQIIIGNFPIVGSVNHLTHDHTRTVRSSVCKVNGIFPHFIKSSSVVGMNRVLLESKHKLP